MDMKKKKGLYRHVYTGHTGTTTVEVVVLSLARFRASASSLSLLW